MESQVTEHMQRKGWGSAEHICRNSKWRYSRCEITVNRNTQVTEIMGKFNMFKRPMRPEQFVKCSYELSVPGNDPNG